MESVAGIKNPVVHESPDESFSGTLEVVDATRL
jgi:hypothetical protein